MLRRYRFQTDADDPRPINWPPPGPFWITGYTGSDFERTIIVAYAPNQSALLENWPEAVEIDDQGEGDPVFSSRFPKPEWWHEEGR